MSISEKRCDSQKFQEFFNENLPQGSGVAISKPDEIMSEVVKYKGSKLLKRPKSGPVFHHV